MTEKLKIPKDADYSAIVPTKNGPVLLTDGWRLYGLFIREDIIKYLEKMDPKDRKRVTIYCKGKPEQVVFWKDTGYGSGYFCETKNLRWSLYKNGNYNKVVLDKRK